jgi:hypothetical protein
MRHESVSGGRGLSLAGVQWYPGNGKDAAHKQRTKTATILPE